jgi:hypothetical protein
VLTTRWAAMKARQARCSFSSNHRGSAMVAA